MIIHSEQEMLNFGKSLAKQSPHVIELIGDVGTGKTTLTRGLAIGLGIKEPITSPSFMISKSYALPSGTGNLIHYDFYRLADPGLISEDLRENLNHPENIIVIEWGNSITELLPKQRTIINIQYIDANERNLSYDNVF